MKLTDIQRDIVHTVVQRYVNLREATSRRDLIRHFKDIGAIDSLQKLPFFGLGADGNYLPLPLAFEYCGDDNSRARARQAAEMVLRVLQNLDEAHPKNNSEVFTFEEFLHHASEMYDQRPTENILRFGLYLVQVFGVFSQWSGDGKGNEIYNFKLHERIITLNAEHVWDEYIKTITAGVQPSTNFVAPEVQSTPRHNTRVRTRSEVFTSGFDEYTVVEKKGSGGSGTVFEVQDSAGQRLALKTLRPNVPRDKVKRFKNEIHFCLRPPSTRIIKVLDYGRTDEGLPFYVMPLCSSTLRDRLKGGIPATNVLELFAQVLDGVEAAHLLGVYHRDLKPENILCNSTGLIVADFGIAHFRESDLLTMIETGSHDRLANFAYAAPEQRFPGRQVDNRADIYALGLILNEMFTQHVPQGTGFRRIKEIVSTYAYLDDLVELMIQHDPTRRPGSIQAVKEELIARGNEFINLQRLDELKRQVVPESQVDDPIVNDPIRVVDKINYTNGILTLKLSRAVSLKFVECFKQRAARFIANPSSAVISLEGDIAKVIVTEHFLQQGDDFLKKYLIAANEEYVERIKKDQREKIEQSRAALKAQIAQAEARTSALGKVHI